MRTVATVPGAIYFLCCASLFVSLLLLMLIRLRGTGAGEQEPADTSAWEGRGGRETAAVPAEEAP